MGINSCLSVNCNATKITFILAMTIRNIHGLWVGISAILNYNLQII